MPCRRWKQSLNHCSWRPSYQICNAFIPLALSEYTNPIRIVAMSRCENPRCLFHSHAFFSPLPPPRSSPFDIAFRSPHSARRECPQSHNSATLAFCSFECSRDAVRSRSESPRLLLPLSSAAVPSSSPVTALSTSSWPHSWCPTSRSGRLRTRPPSWLTSWLPTPTPPALWPRRLCFRR